MKSEIIIVISIGIIMSIFISGTCVAASLDQNGGEIAIQGFDPVLYRTENRAEKGYSSLYCKYSEHNWHFCNSANRELFMKDPKKYAPEYQGYCAYYMTKKGYKKDSDPNVWLIVDGRLFLFANEDFKREWQKDIKKNIEAADKNWGNVI